jgi:hypothetical protein
MKSIKLIEKVNLIKLEQVINCQVNSQQDFFN